jgi:hypothetical protein
MIMVNSLVDELLCLISRYLLLYGTESEENGRGCQKP